MSKVWQIISAPFRSGPRRPLSTRQPSLADVGRTRETPLGMEALDMSVVDEANRRNNALERPTGVFHRSNLHRSGITSADTSIEPINDDETYAAHYYSAYIKKDNRHD